MSRPAEPRPIDRMKLSLYEKVASMLIALLILGGSLVAILLGLWLSAQAFGRPTAVAVSLVPVGDEAGTGDGDEYDPDVQEPGLEYEQDVPSFLESLESIVNIVSDNTAIFSDHSQQDETLLLPGAKKGDGRTRGAGTGLPGRPRRWEFEFGLGVTLTQYAEMLDSLGIELGVLTSDGKVVYVSKLASIPPTVREGNSTDEKRYYLTWVKGTTEQADQRLLERAGVRTEGRLILKFLPPELEADLAAQEQSGAGSRMNSLKGSFFRIQRRQDQYRLELFHQVY